MMQDDDASAAATKEAIALEYHRQPEGPYKQHLLSDYYAHDLWRAIKSNFVAKSIVPRQDNNTHEYLQKCGDDAAHTFQPQQNKRQRETGPQRNHDYTQSFEECLQGAIRDWCVKRGNDDDLVDTFMDNNEGLLSRLSGKMNLLFSDPTPKKAVKSRIRRYHDIIGALSLLNAGGRAMPVALLDQIEHLILRIVDDSFPGQTDGVREILVQHKRKQNGVGKKSGIKGETPEKSQKYNNRDDEDDDDGDDDDDDDYNYRNGRSKKRKTPTKKNTKLTKKNKKTTKKERAQKRLTR